MSDPRELLREVVENGCHEGSEYNGPICWYCGGSYHERFYRPPDYEHAKDCLFVKMEQALAPQEGVVHTLKNRLIVIGWVGIKRCYLNVSKEEAQRRYRVEEELAEDTDLENMTTEVRFKDTFSAYDVGECAYDDDPREGTHSE